MSKTEPRAALRWIGLVIAAALVLVNAAHVALDVENWPFTSAPMYAHAITPDGPRVRFVLRRPDGKRVVLKGAVRSFWVWRSFWKHSWRDPATREARVGAFLEMMAANQAQPPDALDLYLEERRFDGGEDRVTAKRRLARWTPDGVTLLGTEP